MASSDYKFEGWLGHNPEAAQGNMKWGEFKPKAWEETDIDIKISHCGICGSDLHTLSSGWGPANYPVCVGHEIVGTAVRVGSEAKGDIKVGDRVGVGAQNDSCRNRLSSKCDNCSAGLEQYCSVKGVNTYDSFHLNGDQSQGGYATYHRAPSHFVVKIPDALASEHAAPLLCAGITMYSPLKHHGAGPGRKVGIVGTGGLGHCGVIFAKALGADRVVAFSRKASKRDDALALGADEYVATDEDAEWATKHAQSLDLVISTVSSSKVELADYLGLLRRDGALVQVGLPDDGKFHIKAIPVVRSRVSLTGSKIGSPGEIREMLVLAAEKGLKPWIEKRPMSEANTAIQDFNAGKPRYRYVLTN